MKSLHKLFLSNYGFNYNVDHLLFVTITDPYMFSTCPSQRSYTTLMSNQVFLMPF